MLQHLQKFMASSKYPQVIVPRSSWEPSLTKSPQGELIMMFFGNITNPPPVGSDTCEIQKLQGIRYKFQNYETNIL